MHSYKKKTYHEIADINSMVVGRSLMAYYDSCDIYKISNKIKTLFIKIQTKFIKIYKHLRLIIFKIY
jgi:hypothetical protein